MFQEEKGKRNKGELENEMITISLFFHARNRPLSSPEPETDLLFSGVSFIIRIYRLKSQEMVFPSVSLYMKPSPAKGLIFSDLNLKVSLPSFPLSLFKSPHPLPQHTPQMVF